MNKTYVKKALAVAVILLFIGVAFAPSINANVSKVSVDSELVEITTEVCGLNGGKHTVSLSKEEAEEVKNLIDDIERRLDKAETREETVEIFNEAIVELDKYGLLGDLIVEQAQELVIGEFIDSKTPRIFERFANKNNLSEGENKNCLVYGVVDLAFLVPMPWWILAVFLNTHQKLKNWLLDKFMDLPFYLSAYLLTAIGVSALLFSTMYNPFPIFTGVILGYYYPCSGPLFIHGENGNQSFSEDYFGVIAGFTGIKLFIPSFFVILLGVASWSKILLVGK